MAENRPSNVLKLFGVEIAKWEKQTDDGKTLVSFSFQKTYKDKNDQWQHTTFFKLSDLPILATLILCIVGKSAKVQTPSAQAEQTAEQAEGEDVPF